MVDARTAEVATLMQGAALDPTRWQIALDAANAYVGGSGIVLLSVVGRQRFAPASTDLGELMEDYFNGGWYQIDQRDACLPLLKANGIVVDHDFQTPEQIVSSDYYHDFMRPHRRKWFAGVGVSIDGDDWCLALQRAPELDPFGSKDMAKLRFLRRALADTACLSRQVGRSWMSGFEHALNLMTQPAAVLDCRGRVLHINEAAALLLGPHLDKDRNLRFANPQMMARFDAMLKSGFALAAGNVQVIELGARRYACRATSLLDEARLIGTSAAALVVMSPMASAPTSILKSRYGLTEAEIKVAFALADGRSVKDVAAANKVKDDTVRCQLKSIYSKIGINRQAQLVAFMRPLSAQPED